MGKKRQNRPNKQSGGDSSASTSAAAPAAKAKANAAADAAKASVSISSTTKEKSSSSLFQFLSAERQGIVWVSACALIGALIGFGIGTGHLSGAASEPVNPWRKSLGIKIRSSTTYQLLSLRTKPWTPLLNLWETSISLTTSRKNLLGDPGNPRNYDVLKEAILREPGGFVHPDLGMMIPAPSGAARGIGMVRDAYTKVQTRCTPGIASEKMKKPENQTLFMQEEVLIRIPLSYQMTRTTALDTLLPLIQAGDPNRKDPLQELDDAALLVLLLAHERGVSRASRWLPYIASLPTVPSCGYLTETRPYMLDAVAAYGGEVGVDVNGWVRELSKASAYAEKISSGLAKDYGVFIKSPEGVSIEDNLQWALCQVASRATAGDDKYGSLRLVPLMDMINHDANAGGFVELTGEESFDKGDFVDVKEEEKEIMGGMFVVRSLRHGRRKPLRKGQVSDFCIVDCSCCQYGLC